VRNESWLNSTETATDKAAEVHTFVWQLTGIDGHTGFDERHGAANVLSAIQCDNGIDAPSAQIERDEIPAHVDPRR
jgi:hypothetical protein